MISFFVCLALLIAGYFVYGGFVSKTFGPDDRETPAVTMEDGVDYVVMPTWRIFLVQLLNIAGLGPSGVLWAALCGVPVFSCGSPSVPSLPAASMTLLPALCPCGIRV